MLSKLSISAATIAAGLTFASVSIACTPQEASAKAQLIGQKYQALAQTNPARAQALQPRFSEMGQRFAEMNPSDAEKMAAVCRFFDALLAEIEK